MTATDSACSPKRSCRRFVVTRDEIATRDPGFCAADVGHLGVGRALPHRQSRPPQRTAADHCRHPYGDRFLPAARVSAAGPGRQSGLEPATGGPLFVSGIYWVLRLDGGQLLWPTAD